MADSTGKKKRHYRKPRLEKFGDLRKLTGVGGGPGKGGLAQDGGAGGPKSKMQGIGAPKA